MAECGDQLLSRSSMDPLIINLAPTGLLPTRAQAPHVPLMAEEVAVDCARCCAVGASMLHLHAADGSPSCDRAVFGELVAAIRSKVPDAIIVTTTSGRRAPEVELRVSSLTLEGAQKPDMASLLHLGTLAADLPPQSIWSMAGIGRHQAVANALGVAVGHGVRTGPEDNFWLDQAHTALATNLQLVQRMAAQATALGRLLASRVEVRQRLGLASCR
ncbi:MAG: 3-keto-5-aminohexanoate cleavage protein [Sulfuritalea sp.]|nr:3-keto-5-aminohexanoate cleavage protein [Sulfuritalea sp.]